MGMYDHLKVSFQLPDFPKDPPYILQTKNLDCLMDEYSINEQGRLIHHTCEWEPVPDEELPYPHLPCIGSMRKKEGSHKDVDLNYHGYITACEFHTDDVFYDYRFKFTDGKLVEVIRIE